MYLLEVMNKRQTHKQTVTMMKMMMMMTKVRMMTKKMMMMTIMTKKVMTIIIPITAKAKCTWLHQN